jgi:hypothetical protein
MRYKIAILAVLIIGFLCFNASAGCGKWVVRDNTDYLQDPLMDMNDPGPSSASNPNAMQGNAAEPGEKTKAIAPANSTSKPDLSGKWSIKLNGTNNVSADLILIQSNDLADDGRDRIQGYGSFKEKAQTIPITIAGFLSDDTLDMDLELGFSNGASKSNEKYVLRLANAGKTLSGNYELFNSGVLTEKGNASATRSEP